MFEKKGLCVCVCGTVKNYTDRFPIPIKGFLHHFWLGRHSRLISPRKKVASANVIGLLVELLTTRHRDHQPHSQLSREKMHTVLRVSVYMLNLCVRLFAPSIEGGEALINRFGASLLRKAWDAHF